MPLLKPLAEIKSDLQALLADDDSGNAISTLRGLLPEASEKNRQLILLEAKLSKTDKDRRGQLTTHENLTIAYNQINEALLDLIAKLEEKDFDPAAAGVSAQPSATAIPKFVIIYDVADSDASKMLNKHLNVLKFTKKIQVYNVQEGFGDLIAQAKNEIENADYLLVLITVNLFNSEWFELVYNAIGEGRRIIPIRMEQADFEGTGLEKLRSLPSMNRAVSDFKGNPDGAYLDIVTELKKLLPK